VKSLYKFKAGSNPFGSGLVWFIFNAAGRAAVTNYAASGRDRFRKIDIERLFERFDFSTLDFRHA
jgi:hypothetical protein